VPCNNEIYAYIFFNCCNLIVSFDVSETLLKWRADALAKDEHENTALHLACENRHQNCALLLLSHINDEASVNIPNQDLKT
jgi:ankyrin repeat protein